MITDYTLKGKDKLYILPLGDIHLGSPECNLDYLDYWRDMVQRIRNPKRIYLMGDLIETASKKVGNGAYKQQFDVNEQINIICDFLEPLKDDIVFSCHGNHDFLRISKEFDLNVSRLIADRLGCDSGNQCLDTFNINDTDFTVYANHGKGTNAYAHLAQGKIQRETQNIQASLYLQGHNHRLDFFSVPVRTVDGLNRKYYAFTGSFLNYGEDSYPSQMFLPVLPPAFQFITVDKNLNLWDIAYRLDQRRPDLLDVFLKGGK
ncbi:MAG: Calcineurin-like phosphoesterase superfamily domain protein [Methanobacterium sp. PtaU1.Bin242]|nr:MAG: Calcineurin-like phosphoesterase superfamily domain protein [Methanobacterium sp. PtaU1.Bin242]